jgi:hypothetical protein
MLSVDDKLIDRLAKEFKGDKKATVEQMLFITYSGKPDYDKEMQIMKDFPHYRFYFICQSHD